MRTRTRIFHLSVLVLMFLAVGLPAANAYVDPGSGSFIFQALVGGTLAAALALKVFWRRIVSVFSRNGGHSGGSTTERSHDARSDAAHDA